MVQNYAMAVAIVVGVMFVAKVADTVLGQPRTSSGQFDFSRTTQVGMLIKLVGMLVIIYLVAQALAGV